MHWHTRQRRRLPPLDRDGLLAQVVPDALTDAVRLTRVQHRTGCGTGEERREREAAAPDATQQPVLQLPPRSPADAPDRDRVRATAPEPREGVGDPALPRGP